jgi:microcystin-dependent protein
MTDQYVGEIRAVGFNFAPQGWAMCNGQILPISQNTALFSLLGTNYGGNGISTFALPDLQARFPLHANNGQGGAGVGPVDIGEMVGSATVTVTAAQLPPHTHLPTGVVGGGTADSPAATTTFAEARVGRVVEQIYATSGGTQPMAPSALTSVGGDQPHNNLPPYLVVNFIIALGGLFPPRG